ncbi:M23 family metallopeptidase [Janibacter limosus]|uniref:M23 family metallopeptidase n=1 Tax=Janibacter limosus TaxID=53458 RepID=UPI0008339AE3|nr:M23 family metallopeptidase [Janibacter limosus]
MSDYSGRHRPPTRAERRAIERSSRLPKSFGPAYLVPTAAAATLVLTAAGATAAQSSSFTGASAATQARGALLTPTQDQDTASSLLSDPALGESAREEVTASAQERSGLATRRQAASTSVAKDQARTQERKRAARDKARAELAADKKRTSASSTKDSTTAGSTSSESSDTATGAQSWVKPLDNAVFTSPFGQRWGRLHAGQDYAAPIGTPLKALSSGTVVGAGPMSGYGVYIDIKYWDGTVSRYGHLTSVSAAVGQQVAPGDVVALSGNTGHSTGPHLHMEIHPGGGGAIDPAGWLAERGIA